jgi:hypothetical protein
MAKKVKQNIAKKAIKGWFEKWNKHKNSIKVKQKTAKKVKPKPAQSG